MLHLIQSALPPQEPGAPVVELRVERRTLAKRLWRGVAEDGVEFGFDLAAPLQPGDLFFQSPPTRYVIAQCPEPVLEILLADLPPSTSAGIGWAVGNLHLELSSEAHRLLTPDEPAARQLLGRLRVEFSATTAVFRPGRFKRSASALNDLGPSHRH